MSGYSKPVASSSDTAHHSKVLVTPCNDTFKRSFSRNSDSPAYAQPDVGYEPTAAKSDTEPASDSESFDDGDGKDKDTDFTSPTSTKSLPQGEGKGKAADTTTLSPLAKPPAFKGQGEGDGEGNGTEAAKTPLTNTIPWRGSQKQALTDSVKLSSDPEFPPISSPLVTNAYLRKGGDWKSTDYWSEFADDADQTAALTKKLDDAGVLLRHRQTESGDWEAYQVVVRSADVKTYLKEAFEGYPGFDTRLVARGDDNEGEWVFDKPFAPFLHRWDRLAPHQPNWGGNTGVCGSFIDALQKTVLRDDLKKIEKVEKVGEVLFDDLWLVYAPGAIVLAKDKWGNHLHAGRIVASYPSATKVAGQPAWRLEVEVVDSDGVECGWKRSTWNIGWFRGYRRVDSLDAILLDFHHDPEALWIRLMDRGQKFQCYSRGIHFLQFTGRRVAFSSGDSTGYRQTQCESRPVVIDMDAYYSSTQESRPAIRKLESLALNKHEEGSQSDDDTWSATSNLTLRGPDGKIPDAKIANELDDDAEASESGEGPQSIVMLVNAELQHALATGYLRGFDLQSKVWCLFPADGLSEPACDKKAFDQLCLSPPSDKKVIWSLVGPKLQPEADQENPAPGKDRGLVFLLAGKTGTGKTFTAEAIASRAEVPVYAVTAAELFHRVLDDAAVFRKDVGQVFDLCQRWNAILLVEEADNLLGNKTASKACHLINHLEHYGGIMFITAKSSMAIHPAITSRVDKVFKYDALKIVARHQVWMSAIDKAVTRSGIEAEIDGHQVGILAKLYQLNGHEICNAVKHAQMTPKGGGLTYDNLSRLAAARVDNHRLLAK